MPSSADARWTGSSNSIKPCNPPLAASLRVEHTPLSPIRDKFQVLNAALALAGTSSCPWHPFQVSTWAWIFLTPSLRARAGFPNSSFAASPFFHPYVALLHRRSSAPADTSARPPQPSSRRLLSSGCCQLLGTPIQPSCPKFHCYLPHYVLPFPSSPEAAGWLLRSSNLHELFSEQSSLIACFHVSFRKKVVFFFFLNKT